MKWNCQKKTTTTTFSFFLPIIHLSHHHWYFFSNFFFVLFLFRYIWCLYLEFWTKWRKKSRILCYEWSKVFFRLFVYILRMKWWRNWLRFIDEIYWQRKSNKEAEQRHFVCMIIERQRERETRAKKIEPKFKKQK